MFNGGDYTFQNLRILQKSESKFVKLYKDCGKYKRNY